MVHAASLTRARALCVPLGVHVFKQAFNIIHLLSALSRSLFSASRGSILFRFPRFFRLFDPLPLLLRDLHVLSPLSSNLSFAASESTSREGSRNRDETTKISMHRSPPSSLSSSFSARADGTRASEDQTRSYKCKVALGIGWNVASKL